MFDTILFGIVIGIGSHLLIVTYLVVSNIKKRTSYYDVITWHNIYQHWWFWNVFPCYNVVCFVFPTRANILSKPFISRWVCRWLWQVRYERNHELSNVWVMLPGGKGYQVAVLFPEFLSVLYWKDGLIAFIFCSLQTLLVRELQINRIAYFIFAVVARTLRKCLDVVKVDYYSAPKILSPIRSFVNSLFVLEKIWGI